MSHLAGKRIVLGVSGGIAAYKAIEVCRRLVDAGAHVSPILTGGALHFVGETTFSALASEPVQRSLWNETSPIPHTELGQNADLIIVCPATAKTIAAYTIGFSSDLLGATLLATRAPVIVCPAMHTEMWEHPSTQDNMAVLRRRGVHIVGPGSGRLAGGDIGEGRLVDPSEIVAAAERVLSPGDLVGLSVVVSAGGTREPLDPVRFLGNRSSGKQGHAIALEAAARGASVTLVSTAPTPSELAAKIVRVETAHEMHSAIAAVAPTADVIVMAAAVADFRPKAVADAKIKKAGGVPEIILEPTVDILSELGRNKPSGQTLVGFAAETNDVRANAQRKLEAKNADLLVANDVGAENVGFEHDTNEVVILSATGTVREVPLTDKRSVARAVIDAIVATRSVNEPADEIATEAI